MAPIALLVKAYAFSAARHNGQTRKDAAHTPYVNHPIQVAQLLSEVAGVEDPEVLMAAVLHDTVEDTGVTEAEIARDFGPRVASLVAECTDDKSLPQAERKRLQVEHASHKTNDARLIKLADKITNVSDIIHAQWPVERKRAYLEWAAQVAVGLHGVNAALDARFDSALNEARKALPPK
jgi:GTP diphosphokinase / guanosine-3',5'-bis(diphosphate) 3'-diphosphatase